MQNEFFYRQQKLCPVSITNKNDLIKYCLKDRDVFK